MAAVLILKVNRTVGCCLRRNHKVLKASLKRLCAFQPCINLPGSLLAVQNKAVGSLLYFVDDGLDFLDAVDDVV